MPTTNFPTGIDSWTDKVDNVDTVYANDINQANDAIVQLETKVGINSSAVTTTIDYKLSGIPASDKAVSLTGSEKLQNKTLSTGVKLDANADQNFTEYGMARQAIMNGNFDIWQRGTSVALADSTLVYQADRWVDIPVKDGGTLPTLTRSMQLLTSGDIPGAFYFSRLATDGAGTSLGVNSAHTYFEKIENGVQKLCGASKKVTVSFWARSSIASKRICPTVYQNYGTGGSPTATEFILGTPITLTSTWTKYTATFTTNTLVGKTFGTNKDDCIQFSIHCMWGTTFGNTYISAGVTAETYVGSGNIDIAQVQLCAGDVALPFQPKSAEEETRQCQRYYEQSSNGNQICWCGNTTNATLYYFPTVFYKVTKRISVTPTFSYSNISGFPVATPTVYRANADGFMTTAIANATVSGGIHIDDWVASAEL